MKLHLIGEYGVSFSFSILLFSYLYYTIFLMYITNSTLLKIFMKLITQIMNALTWQNKRHIDTNVYLYHNILNSRI